MNAAGVGIGLGVGIGGGVGIGAGFSKDIIGGRLKFSFILPLSAELRVGESPLGTEPFCLVGSLLWPVLLSLAAGAATGAPPGMPGFSNTWPIEVKAKSAEEARIRGGSFMCRRGKN